MCTFVECAETIAREAPVLGPRGSLAYEGWLDVSALLGVRLRTRTGSTREYSEECALSLLRPLFIGAYIYVRRYVFACLWVCVNI